MFIMAKANAKAPVGQGGKFAAMKQRLAKQKGDKKVEDPGAMAAFIGRKKYGPHQMAMMARAGRK